MKPSDEPPVVTEDMVDAAATPLLSTLLEAGVDTWLARKAVRDAIEAALNASGHVLVKADDPRLAQIAFERLEREMEKDGKPIPVVCAPNELPVPRDDLTFAYNAVSSLAFRVNSEPGKEELAAELKECAATLAKLLGEG
jgi:hypothetical protein